MDSGEIHELIKEAVEASKLSGTKLEYEPTMSAETESLSANLNVRFAERGASSAVSVTQLIDRLTAQTTVNSVDLHGPPLNHLVLQGSAQAVNYKIVLQLH